VRAVSAKYIRTQQHLKVERSLGLAQTACRTSSPATPTDVQRESVALVSYEIPVAQHKNGRLLLLLQLVACC
jgi:hypothetical protein